MEYVQWLIRKEILSQWHDLYAADESLCAGLLSFGIEKKELILERIERGKGGLHVSHLLECCEEFGVEVSDFLNSQEYSELIVEFRKNLNGPVNSRKIEHLQVEIQEGVCRQTIYSIHGDRIFSPFPDKKALAKASKQQKMQGIRNSWGREVLGYFIYFFFPREYPCIEMYKKDEPEFPKKGFNMVRGGILTDSDRPRLPLRCKVCGEIFLPQFLGRMWDNPFCQLADFLVSFSSEKKEQLHPLHWNGEEIDAIKAALNSLVLGEIPNRKDFDEELIGDAIKGVLSRWKMQPGYYPEFADAVSHLLAFICGKEWVESLLRAGRWLEIDFLISRLTNHIPKPFQPKMQFLRGLLAFCGKRFSDSIAIFSKLQRYFPDYLDCTFFLGRTYYEKGDYRSARKHFEMCLKKYQCKFPKNPGGAKEPIWDFIFSLIQSVKEGPVDWSNISPRLKTMIPSGGSQSALWIGKTFLMEGNRKEAHFSLLEAKNLWENEPSVFYLLGLTSGISGFPKEVTKQVEALRSFKGGEEVRGKQLAAILEESFQKKGRDGLDMDESEKIRKLASQSGWFYGFFP